MSSYSLRTPVVDPNLLIEVATAMAGASTPLSISDIERVIDRSEDYSKSIANLGLELGLIEVADDDENNADENYVIVREVKMQFRQASPEQRTNLLLGLLQGYKPFISFSSALLQGVDPERAALRADVLYELGIDEGNLEAQFRKLGIYTGVFEETDEGIGFQFDTRVLTDEYIQEFSDAVGTALVARLYLENRLGEEIMEYMDNGSVDELINALELFMERPRSAIAAAGRAVEDFERLIGTDHGDAGTDYSEAEGIGQLTSKLQGDDLLMKRHLHGGNYLAGLRNPSGGHGKDPETLERWDVGPEVALGYVLASIHFIRSLHTYVIQERQVL